MAVAVARGHRRDTQWAVRRCTGWAQGLGLPRWQQSWVGVQQRDVGFKAQVLSETEGARKGLKGLVG